MEKLNGPFKDIIPNFVNFKKSLGYKYDNINSYILIDKILYEHKIYDLSDTKNIFEILINKEETKNKKQIYYNSLKELYEYLKLIGYNENELYFEYNYNFSTTKNYIPYILTHNEILEFFKVIDDKYIENNKVCYPVLFRLVYGCGLRISEALNLRITDFSLENKTILIKKSKNNVSRILPLSNSMYKILKNYKENIIPNNREYLFELKKRRLSYSTVMSFFYEISKENNYEFTPHCLRHTFAVHTFNKLFDQGKNENWIIYYLHIYLGHKNIKSTEHYLHLTSSRFKKAEKIFVKNNKDLFPEIGDIDGK